MTKEDLMRAFIAKHSKFWWEFKQSRASADESAVTPAMQAWSDAIDLLKELDEPAAIDFDSVFKDGRDRAYQGDLQNVRYYDGWQDAVRYLREKINMLVSGRDGKNGPRRKVYIERMEGDVHWSFSIWQEESNDELMHIHQGRPSLDFEEVERESREWLRGNP